MTVAVDTPRREYAATGGQTIFPYPGPLRASTELLVYKNASLLVYLSAYTLTGVGSASGNVVLTVGATAGDQLVLERVRPLTQLTDYAPGGAFPALAQEEGLDHQMLIAQQLQAAVNRCLQLSRVDAYGRSGVTLPLSASVGQAAYLRWNAAGTALETVAYPPPPYTPPPGTTTLLGGINVKDAGAVGDGVNDDTVVLQALLDELPAGGGLLYFPRGTYRLTAALTCTNTPLRLVGEGADLVILRQDTTGQNGLTYVSTLAGNMVPGTTNVPLSLTLQDLTFVRGAGSSGGAAIRGTWEAQTSDQTHCTLENIHITWLQNFTDDWEQGVHLTDVNGTRFTNLNIRGNPAEAAGVVDFPFSLQNGILFDGDLTEGKITHLWNGISVLWANVAINIQGWYEGMYVTNGELAFVSIGLQLDASTTAHGQTVMTFQNLHISFRLFGVLAKKVNNLWLQQIDLYKDGGTGAPGLAGAGVDLEEVRWFQWLGGKFRAPYAALSNGVQTDSLSHQGLISGVTFDLIATGTAVVIQGDQWMIGPCVWHDVAQGVSLAGDLNTVAPQVFGGTITTPLQDTGVGNFYQAALRYYVNAHSVTLTGGGPTEAINIALPTGLFGVKPTVGLVQGAEDDVLFVAFYLHAHASSTATNAHVYLKTIDGSNLVAGAYRINYYFHQ